MRHAAGHNEAIMEAQPTNDMGNSLRNKHMLRQKQEQRVGDFVMFSDDDN